MHILRWNRNNLIVSILFPQQTVTQTHHMHRLLGSASDGRKKWCASIIQDFISPVHMTAVVASAACRSTSSSIRFTAFTTSRVRNAKEITKLRFWCSRIGTNPPPPNPPYHAIQISTSSKTSFSFFLSFWLLDRPSSDCRHRHLQRFCAESENNDNTFEDGRSRFVHPGRTLASKDLPLLLLLAHLLELIQAFFCEFYYWVSEVLAGFSLSTTASSRAALLHRSVGGVAVAGWTLWRWRWFPVAPWHSKRAKHFSWSSDRLSQMMVESVCFLFVIGWFRSCRLHDSREEVDCRFWFSWTLGWNWRHGELFKMS